MVVTGQELKQQVVPLDHMDLLCSEGSSDRRQVTYGI